MISASTSARCTTRRPRFFASASSTFSSFTAVLTMQCRDEGLLDLDDPISAHLKVLYDAGLVSRHGQDKQVLYVCTERGRNLAGH